MNITINVPEGSSSHGDPNLLCTPPEWYDYILFFFTNYFAHAATIIAVPGQSITETICVAVTALLVPSSGIMRAVEVVIRRPLLRAADPLSRAAAATALCMVVKVHCDADGDPTRNIDFSDYPWMQHLNLIRYPATLHGRADLPRGYTFAYVPRSGRLKLRKRRHEDAGKGSTHSAPQSDNRAESQTVNEGDAVLDTTPQPSSDKGPERTGDTKLADDDAGNETGKIPGDLAASYNIPKAIISLAQGMWAIVTLYRSRGNQIRRYGYAAFGLTVAPYAYMSVINLIATCLTPEYPAIFMVRTPLMDEAEAQGAVIAGEVACIDMDLLTIDNPQLDDNLAAWLSGFLLSLPPLAIVGALSQFSAGSSSIPERGFTMTWLATGIFGGLWAYFWQLVLFENENKEGRARSSTREKGRIYAGFTSLVAIPLAAPAVGGFVVVAQMLREYGVCVRYS
ncbi:hypothetical protein BJY01DRAFT_217123 [Aspergillus pseudoustus]|uniref:Uncharacterized protein n=1 Tax=Aspergillus pseudoustus TaxID=1810923 RepID=A0ABR4JNW0_9EURO